MRIALLAIGALGLQVVTAHTAAASCGDWLAGHESVTADASDAAVGEASSIFSLRDFSSVIRTASSDADLPTQRPCNGPGCRQLPTMPDTPLSPVTTRVIAPQWLLGVSLTDLFGLPLSGRVPAERNAVLLPAMQERIERPPRSC